MEKLMGPVTSTFKNIVTLTEKPKHVALNTALRFSLQALKPHSKISVHFGSLNQHFFSSHNPHPHRVTHIQGLNGAPVCILNDEWSEQAMLPPHPMIKSQFHTSILGEPGVQMPIGDPQPIPVPKLSIDSLPDAWRDELREFTARGRAASFIEKKILELLCQILQTDSLTAMQKWQLTAGQKEKNLVMELLQIATANLYLESQDSPPGMEEGFPSHFPQSSTGFAFRQHRRNDLTRLPVTKQKQEPIPEEERQCISAQWIHLSLDEKQSQPNQSK